MSRGVAASARESTISLRTRCGHPAQVDAMNPRCGTIDDLACFSALILGVRYGIARSVESCVWHEEPHCNGRSDAAIARRGEGDKRQRQRIQRMPHQHMLPRLNPSEWPTNLPGAEPLLCTDHLAVSPLLLPTRTSLNMRDLIA
jgi:hypothetical protein